MQKRPYILSGLWLAIFCLGLFPAKAQLGYDLTIKKPAPYENRELKAERSGRKKFTAPRRFFQNAYTHYNYFFNAHNRLNQIIALAKESFHDDYTQLLPFYNYSLETTAQSKTELDSVIYKAKTGILMHDLRNDWIDDMYLLWGVSYFLQKEFDSSYQMFQFINYAFAEKEKDGYYRYIGSRMDGNNALSIVSKEDQGFLKRMVSDPPSRNTAFIWQARTLIESGAMTEAGSLIATLKKDPDFPERLVPSLNEVEAYWFYKNKMWDSSAAHLANALDNTSNRDEKARWEYLIAQMDERAGLFDQAAVYYARAIGHTNDPVMDVYARLNLIRINKSGGDDYINRNIADLLKMAHKERFAEYRDVIYSMAAQMEMERNHIVAAREYLQKAAKYNGSNPASRNHSYLQLADLLYAQRSYPAAASFYDSVDVTSLPHPADADRVKQRKASLEKIIKGQQTIQQQDSLQRIAALPEPDRTDFLKRLARQLRRQKGLKTEDNFEGLPATSATLNSGSSGGSPDLFNTPAKGEWYFYNASLKSQGLATFKQLWGNRPNVDNWRRASDATTELRAGVPENTRGNPAAEETENAAAGTSYDGLLAGLPLTPAKINASNDQIRTSLVTMGAVYLNEMEDYPSAIETYEELRKRFPDYFDMSIVLLNLYYSYSKSGQPEKAAQIKELLAKNYPTSRQATILTSGVDPLARRPTPEVTKTYEGIYDLFIEGKFDEALAAKQQADSLYKTNYWSPQLLYIESVYYAKQRQDSLAITTLNLLQKQNPNTPMAAKAATLADVLSRRRQIEEELTNLQIERPAEDSAVAVSGPAIAHRLPQALSKDSAAVVRKDLAGIKVDSAALNRQLVAPKMDTVAQIPDPAVRKKDTAVLNRAMVNDRIAATANRDSISGNRKPVTLNPPPIAAPARPKTDTIAAARPAPPAKPKPAPSALFSFDDHAPHYVLVALNKVDVVFGNEAKNAFNRYNREKYYNTQLNIQLVNLDADNRLLLIGSFSNAQQAVEYAQKAKSVSTTDIIPWLKQDKYSFSIISDKNLEVLKTNPDLEKYKKFIEESTQTKL